MLLAGLPPVVRVNVRGSNAGIWLEASVRYALAEARSPRPGGAGVLAKLAEVLFIEVLRLYIADAKDDRTGWLAGLGDRIVGGALNALHKRPAHAWTLDELARASGTSRSVLAERFQQLVGSSPMQYLTQWRMLLAANLLSRSNAPLARIAEDVGYQTDTGLQPRVPPRVRRATGGLAKESERTRARAVRRSKYLTVFHRLTGQASAIDKFRSDHDSGSNMISRTSCAHRHPRANRPAQTSASSREGTSMMENPPMTAFVSGEGPDAMVPSVATMVDCWRWIPAPKIQTPAALASRTTAREASPPPASPGRGCDPSSRRRMKSGIEACIAPSFRWPLMAARQSC